MSKLESSFWTFEAASIFPLHRHKWLVTDDNGFLSQGWWDTCCTQWMGETLVKIWFSYSVLTCTASLRI